MQDIFSFINKLQQNFGHFLAWFGLMLVLTTFAVVVLRYGFSLGWVAMQESLTYLHVILFMGGMAYTLQQDEHVRVDIFYHKVSLKARAWIDLIGTLALLLPMCSAIFWLSWHDVVSAWAIKEGSLETGGLPWLYLLKTMVLLMTSLLILQGFSLVYSKVTVLSKD